MILKNKEVVYQGQLEMKERDRRLLLWVVKDWIRFRGDHHGDGTLEAAEKFQNFLEGLVPDRH